VGSLETYKLERDEIGQSLMELQAQLQQRTAQMEQLQQEFAKLRQSDQERIREVETREASVKQQFEQATQQYATNLDQLVQEWQNKWQATRQAQLDSEAQLAVLKQQRGQEQAQALDSMQASLAAMEQKLADLQHNMESTQQDLIKAEAERSAALAQVDALERQVTALGGKAPALPSLSSPSSTSSFEDILTEVQQRLEKQISEQSSLQSVSSRSTVAQAHVRTPSIASVTSGAASVTGGIASIKLAPPSPSLNMTKPGRLAQAFGKLQQFGRPFVKQESQILEVRARPADARLYSACKINPQQRTKKQLGWEDAFLSLTAEGLVLYDKSEVAKLSCPFGKYKFHLRTMSPSDLRRVTAQELIRAAKLSFVANPDWLELLDDRALTFESDKTKLVRAQQTLSVAMRRHHALTQGLNQYKPVVADDSVAKLGKEFSAQMDVIAGHFERICAKVQSRDPFPPSEKTRLLETKAKWIKTLESKQDGDKDAQKRRTKWMEVLKHGIEVEQLHLLVQLESGDDGETIRSKEHGFKHVSKTEELESTCSQCLGAVNGHHLRCDPCGLVLHPDCFCLVGVTCTDYRHVKQLTVSLLLSYPQLTSQSTFCLPRQTKEISGLRNYKYVEGIHCK